MSLELWQRRIRKAPPSRVTREVVEKGVDIDGDAAPVLCVTGDSRGAGAFEKHWLPHIVMRGRAAYAVSVRGQGNTPRGDSGMAGKVHDLVQTAVSLPRRAILIGHGQGALWLAHAATRYPVHAMVLLAPRGLRRPPAAPVGGAKVLVAGSSGDGRARRSVLSRSPVNIRPRRCCSPESDTTS